MRRRRASLAVLAALACATGVVTAVAPASADTVERLVSTQLTVIPIGSQTIVSLKMRTSGDAVRLDYEYDVTTGTIPTIRFTGSTPVTATEVTKGDVLPAFAPSGSYTLKVTVVGADGSSATYLPDGHAQWCSASGCGTPIGGLTVLSGTGFTRASGPATLAAVVANAAHLTSGDLTTPATGGHVSVGGTVATTMGYAGATTGAPPNGTSLFPVYAGDGTSAFFAGPPTSVGATAGTATSSGAGPTQATTWQPYAYVVRTGLVDRVSVDQDRAWLHTVWPLSATSLATMPAACGIEPGLHPSTTCTLVDTVASPATGGGTFYVDGAPSFAGAWWTMEVSGGSADTSQVVPSPLHFLTFTVHYKGIASPLGEPVSVTVAGPGSASLSTSSFGPTCPFNAITGYYECDIPIRVSNVLYNGTYTVTSVTVAAQDTPNLVCAPGPSATLTGYNLYDTTSTSTRLAQLCGSISWSALRATVTGRNALPCADSSPPVLTAFARTSATAFDSTNSPTTGSASFHWAAADSGCGLTRVSATFVRPDGVSWVATTSMSARASGSGTVTLTPQPGSWALRRVTVTDAVGNLRQYDSDGIASAVIAGATRPWALSPHVFDLASAGVLGTAGAPPAGVPAPARGLSVTRGGTALALTWLAPSPATGVTGYTATIRSALDGTVTTQTTTATRATFTGLGATTPYDVWVEARHGSVVSAWTPLFGPVTPTVGPVLTPPAVAPTLRALTRPVRATTVPLVVAAQALPGYPVTGYVLQWSHATAARAMSAWSDLGGVSSRPPTAVRSLALGTKLCVRVVAVNAAGRGPASSSGCTAVPLDDRSLSRSSGWSRPRARGFFLGTLTTSSRRGAALTFTATGHGLALLVRTNPGAGTIGVYVGSRRVARISLVSRRTHVTTVLVSSRATGAMAGSRVTLRVETSGRTVAIDGAAVLP